MSRLQQIALSNVLQYSVQIQHMEKKLNKNFQIIVQNIKAQKHKLDLLHQQNISLKQQMKRTQTDMITILNFNNQIRPALDGIKTFTNQMQDFKNTFNLQNQKNKKFQAQMKIDKETNIQKINLVSSQMQQIQKYIKNKVDQFDSIKSTVQNIQTQIQMSRPLPPQKFQDSQNKQKQREKQKQPSAKLLKLQLQSLKSNILNRIQKINNQVFNCVKKQDLQLILNPLQGKLKSYTRILDMKIDVSHYGQIVKQLNQFSQKAQSILMKNQNNTNNPQVDTINQKKSQQSDPSSKNRTKFANKSFIPRPSLPTVVQIISQNQNKTMVQYQNVQIDAAKKIIQNLQKKLIKIQLNVNQSQQKRIYFQQKLNNDRIDNEKRFQQLEQLFKNSSENQDSKIRAIVQSFNNKIDKSGLQKKQNIIKNQFMQRDKDSLGNKIKFDHPKDLFKMQFSAFSKDIDLKLQSKQNKQQANRKLNQIMMHIGQLKNQINKKADFQTMKKNLQYFQNKVNQIGYIVVQRQQDMQAVATKRGWSCLSCQKKIDKLQSFIGDHKNWNNMPYKYDVPKLGGFNKAHQRDKAYKSIYMPSSKRIKQDSQLPSINHQNQQ